MRHARYGPRDRYQDPPAAGMCISVFAVITRGTRVMIGVPKPHPAWKTKWIFSWATYAQEELQEAYREKRLPSTYLLEGEHPEDALRRIMRQQLGIPEYSSSGPRVYSYNAPSNWYPGHDHWDLVFVYDVKIHGKVEKPAWWSGLGFVEKNALRAEDFGWNSDFVQDIGVVPARSAYES